MKFIPPFSTLEYYPNIIVDSDENVILKIEDIWFKKKIASIICSQLNKQYKTKFKIAIKKKSFSPIAPILVGLGYLYFKYNIPMKLIPICNKCGSIAKKSKAFGDAIATESDEVGKKTIHQGQGDLIDCYKCTSCGHSWT